MRATLPGCAQAKNIHPGFGFSQRSDRNPGDCSLRIVSACANHNPLNKRFFFTFLRGLKDAHCIHRPRRRQACGNVVPDRVGAKCGEMPGNYVGHGRQFGLFRPRD